MRHEKRVSRLRNREYRQSYFESHFDTSIAAQIKANREARMMSQKELARKSGLFQSQISKLEDVNYSSWTVKTLRKIARALDLVLTIRFERYGKALEIRDAFPGSLVQPSFDEDDLAQSEAPATTSSLMNFSGQGESTLLKSLVAPMRPTDAELSENYIGGASADALKAFPPVKAMTGTSTGTGGLA